jgi:transposase-like protein
VANWQTQYDVWKRRDLSDLELVYLWADGVYVKAGLERDKAALLVMIGALSNGEKVILAVESGYRESADSWGAMLRDLKARGLRAPKLTIADGHLGIWAALGSVYPTSAEQRCWNHKLRNVLDVVSKKRQPEVKLKLQEIAAAETRKDCEALKPMRRCEIDRRAVALFPASGHTDGLAWESLEPALGPERSAVFEEPVL